MSHAKSGKKIEHAGRHRGTSYDYDHRMAEEDSRVLRRAQDKQAVQEAIAQVEGPKGADSGWPAYLESVYSEPD